MFIYLGTVVGVLLPRPGSPYRRYNLFVPNVSSTYIEAFTLEQPGVHSLYLSGDTVAVADVEADDFDYLILGKMQLQKPDKRAVNSLVVEQVEIQGGRISNEVSIRNEAKARNSEVIDSVILPKEVSIKSLQVDFYNLTKPVYQPAEETPQPEEPEPDVEAGDDGG